MEAVAEAGYPPHIHDVLRQLAPGAVQTHQKTVWDTYSRALEIRSLSAE